MLADLISVGQVFEAAMLICFGLSWPISILKSWRTKFVRGKSAAFLALIFVGYLCGVSNKLVRALHGGDWPEMVTGLYALNAMLVGLDLVLYFRYRHNLEPATEEVARDIARLTRRQE
jgi:urea transporter